MEKGGGVSVLGALVRRGSLERGYLQRHLQRLGTIASKGRQMCRSLAKRIVWQFAFLLLGHLPFHPCQGQ